MKLLITSVGLIFALLCSSIGFAAKCGNNMQERVLHFKKGEQISVCVNGENAKKLEKLPKGAAACTGETADTCDNIIDAASGSSATFNVNSM